MVTGVALLFLAMDIETFFEPEEILNLVVACFAIVLLALSLTAYRRTNLRRLLLVSAAFGLFALQAAIRYFEALVPVVGVLGSQLLLTSLDFSVLLLFFLALVVER